MATEVLLLATGGTISMQDRGEGAVPALDGGVLGTSIDLAPSVELVVEDLPARPGAHLTFEHLGTVAARIEEAARSGYVGVVVTQGTDTIEEVVFGLQLVVRSPIPVVVTGAMRTASQPGPDGPANLADAVTVAAADELVGVGAVVVFAGAIHAGTFVRKSHTTAPAAFTSSCGPLGWVAESQVILVNRPALVPRLHHPVDLAALGSERLPGVAVVPVGFATPSGEVDAVLARPVAGAVVDAVGGGHVPSDLVEPLATLAERIPVVLCARPGDGPVLRETYGFPGSERDLLARGLLHGGLLDARKARVALTLLIASGADRTAIARFFDQSSWARP